MTEHTDTNTNRIEEGRYLFTVKEAPEKFRTQTGKIRFSFEFGYEHKGEMRTYKESFMAWAIGNLLRGLECKEVEPNIFDWELTEVVGKQVYATIEYQPDKNDTNKKWARMTKINSPDMEIKQGEEIPF